MGLELAIPKSVTRGISSKLPEPVRKVPGHDQWLRGAVYYVLCKNGHLSPEGAVSYDKIREYLRREYSELTGISDKSLETTISFVKVHRFETRGGVDLVLFLKLGNREGIMRASRWSS